MASEPTLWGPVELKQWCETPCISGRLATEDDVKSGRAVFYVGNASEIGAHSADIDLPRCAIVTDDDGTKIPVVVIQSEKAEDKHYIGYRPIHGGNGICLIHEVELLDVPDERFEKYD